MRAVRVVLALCVVMLVLSLTANSAAGWTPYTAAWALAYAAGAAVCAVVLVRRRRRAGAS